MNRLDKLIIKAKKVCGTTELRLSYGMIFPIDGGKWKAEGSLWNYIPYKLGSRFEKASCICESVEEAIEALEQLGEQYPNKEDITIVIDDISEEGLVIH